jgi:hypothetical protein
MSERQDSEAARLRAIEERLALLQRADRARALGGPSAQADALREVEGLLAESKQLARDGQTATFARIAIQAGWLIGRLDRGSRAAPERGS